MIKTRIFPESNYRSIWCNGKTLRFAIDSSKPITELAYPEFYDLSLTNKCLGNCPYCYQDSKLDIQHPENIVQKVRDFFGPMTQNQRPFQVALGGGEPTGHPEFLELLRVLKEELDVCPNYTTNGMWADDLLLSPKLLDITKKYCGGVAISCHSHLKQYWSKAAYMYFDMGIKLNFHIIISDYDSINQFRHIYNQWKEKVDYFVLLPYGNQGRAEKKEIDWEYLITQLPEDQSKLAFGANFYPYLLKGGHNINVCLYEPEIMSRYITLSDMKIHPSSFNVIV